MRNAFAAALLLFAGENYSQSPKYDAGNILHEMQGLRTAATVLYVAAHPDDENTRLISYLVNGRHYRTAYLSLTRGEGGQNLIGSEQGAPLGILRTHELHAARRIDGGEQYFSSAADFGYSKDPGETLKKWDHETILGEMVLVIRKLRPDVIICRFPASGEGGHGHHTASAILAAEAFDAAADASRFPDQLEYYPAWKTRRIYWNTFNFRSGNTIGPGQFTLDVGGFDPLLGKSYGEIASASRSMHKSQGFGTVAQRGSNIEYFKLLKGDSSGTDIFSGIDTQMARFPELKKADQLAEKCIASFNAMQPHSSVAGLIKLRKALQQLNPKNDQVTHWKALKLATCDRLITACSGLWLEASCSTPSAVPGSSVEVKITALNRTPVEITFRSVLVGDKPQNPDADLKANKTFTTEINVTVPPDQRAGNPFWLESGSAALQRFTRSAYAGRYVQPPALEAEIELVIMGETLMFRQDVVFRRGDPVKGEVSHPLYIVPALNISFPERVYLAGDKSQQVRYAISSNTGSIQGTARIHLPDRGSISPTDSTFTFTQAGDRKLIEAEVKPSRERDTIRAIVKSGHKEYHSTLKWIEHDHIPRQMMLQDAEAIIVNPELERGIRKVAYIPGAGDEVARCLSQAGYEVTVLDDDKSINTENLKKFDAVVTGIRAFNSNENLHAKMPILLSYVKDGGNLIVQYNTNSHVGPLAFVPGPFPYTITRKRVTDEDASVQFLLPDHPALNSPNKITEKDFKGWVQERGIYFAETNDERYQHILAMKDPGEEELNGSLMVAKYGKGNFVYTGLAFFRQLPAGVPGAYRLFANLLSLPQGKEK